MIMPSSDGKISAVQLIGFLPENVPAIDSELLCSDEKGIMLASKLVVALSLEPSVVCATVESLLVSLRVSRLWICFLPTCSRAGSVQYNLKQLLSVKESMLWVRGVVVNFVVSQRQPSSRPCHGCGLCLWM